MLFDIKQFEQFFKDRVLKRGLKLFEKGELEFMGREAGFTYSFDVKGFQLVLKKKGDKLLHFTCSCNKNEYCEHFAASLFYFQQEALGISVKNKVRKQAGALKPGKQFTVEETLRKTESESLLKFIRHHKHELSAPELLSFLSNKSTISVFDVYNFQLEALLEPYLSLKKLDEAAIRTITKDIQAFIKSSRKHFRKEDHSLYLDLALVCAFSPILSLRFSDDETVLLKIYKDALGSLESMYERGLTVTEKQVWFKASLLSVRSNKSLYSEAFMFLIPRMVNSSNSETELLALEAALKKRAYKIPYTHQFDKLLIVRLEVAIRQWKLFQTPFPVQADGTEAELILAKAELLFCGNEPAKAFELLESEYTTIRTVYKNYYNDYLEYLITRARKLGFKEIELKYIRESFIYGLFILPGDLDRYIALLPADSYDSGLSELVEKIRNSTSGYYFDKLSVLLMRINRLDELIAELAKQNNKFILVHEIALKKFPDYNEKFLFLYMRHLSETLRQDSVYSYQVKVFNTAREFLDKLPEETVIKLIKKLLDQIGKTGHLYRYINEMYNYPFLKEESHF